jgi:hypothetical protein
MFGILIITASLAVSQPAPSSLPSAEVPRIPEAVPGEFTEAVMPLVQAMRARVKELFSAERLRQESVPTITRGVEALGVDWGDPAVNFDYQDTVTNYMLVALQVAPEEEREAAREVLRAGLLHFHEFGGYQGVDAPESVRPAMRIARASLAEALVHAARSEDEEVRTVLQEVVGRMESDGTAWTPEMITEFASTHGVPAAEHADRMARQDQRLVERFQDVMGLETPPEQLAAMVEALTGDKRAAVEAVRLRAMDDELREAAPWLLGDENDSGGGLAAGSDDPCLSRYRKASAAALKEARTLGKDLRHLSRRGMQDPARIETITKAVLKGVGDECLDQGLLATLLVSYRSLLTRPGATDRVVQSIDRGLQQTGAQRLEPPRVRVLWARAAGAMGSQASDACRVLVRSVLESEKDQQVRKALEKARSDLASSHRP